MRKIAERLIGTTGPRLVTFARETPWVNYGAIYKGNLLEFVDIVPGLLGNFERRVHTVANALFHVDDKFAYSETYTEFMFKHLHQQSRLSIAAGASIALGDAIVFGRSFRGS